MWLRGEYAKIDWSREKPVTTAELREEASEIDELRAQMEDLYGLLAGHPSFFIFFIKMVTKEEPVERLPALNLGIVYASL